VGKGLSLALSAGLDAVSKGAEHSVARAFLDHPPKAVNGTKGPVLASTACVYSVALEALPKFPDQLLRARSQKRHLQCQYTRI
jgi:hypothetical protein